METILSSMNGKSFGAQIRERLLLEIKRLSANDRLPPETQLAEQYGVNRLTVNKVMAELSREGYIERIRGKGTFVARPDKRILTPRASRRKLGQIVIAYPDYHSFDLWSKVNCAEDLAHRNDMELVNFKMNQGTAYESITALIKERGPDVKGVILLPPASIINAKSIALMDSLGIPVVLLAACDRPVLGKNVVSVYRDYYKEGFLAMEYLIGKGHRRLGYVANEPWNLGSKLQYSGVKAALYQHGFNLKDLAKSPPGMQSWENAMEAGYRFTIDLLKKHSLTALMYRSIPGAVGGMRAIAQAGLRMPEDISLIAEGEASSLEEYLVPPLTNIVCDYRAWVGVALDAILNPERRHEKQIIIDVQLIERKSVRTID